jgi:anhydro-N-acetylmuramic acid kinase
VLDGLARLASDGARTRDEDGTSAARGTPGGSLLAELLADPFFAQPPPRSTGREHFGDHYAVTLRDVGNRMGLSDDDVMATAVALTAASVADAIERFVRPLGAVDRVIASGGGVRNAALMRALAARLAPAPLEELGALGVDPQAKEAIAFAYLAHRTLCGLPGNLPAATGASRPVVLGTITPGR